MDPISQSPLLTNEPLIRFGFFAVILAVMALLETFYPRRKRLFSRKIRWGSNFALIIVTWFLVRLVMPFSLLWLAADSALRGIGLFNMIDLPFGLVMILSVILLDLAIYAQHVAFHYVPLLWRLHRLHHADLDFDVTTGFRFHPLEILLSLGVKAGLILLIGPPALAILVFEILLSGMALFNHANFRLPAAADRFFRLFVVTPDYHRVHHSVVMRETNSNFGFNLTLWDRLFGTYRPQPESGHEEMQIGIEQFRAERELWLDRMLLQPFRKSR